MTNSPIDDATPTNTLPKPKGPIRTGAVIPTVILLLICFVFFHFFFDWSFKRALTWTGSHFYGAEVDIHSLKTSFWHGSIQIRGIELTDKQNPALDFLRIGEIHFGFLWDALLRLKFVVNNAGVDGIALYAPRVHPGWLKPSPKPSSGKTLKSNASAESIGNSVVSQVKKLSPGDTLSGLAGLLQGTKQEALVKDLQGGLKSEARIKELQTEIKQKQKEWQQKFAALPQKKDFINLINRAKALKFNPRNPKQFAENLQQAAEIKSELDQKLKQIKGTTDAFQSDVRNLTAQYKGIDQLVQQDIADTEASLHIGNLDAKTLTQALFMNWLAQKLGAYAKYMSLAREYMPAVKKSSSKKSSKSSGFFMAHARSHGRTFRFPITTGYPLFWLKRADISSKATASGFSGNITGSLTNVTTDPAIVGQPAVLDVKGDFPKADVYKIHLNVTINHVHKPLDTMKLSVGSYPVSAMKLVNSSSLHLGLKNAEGDSLIRAAYNDQTLNFNLQNTYTNVIYNIRSPSTQVKQILDQILTGIPTVTLDASATGSLDHLNIGMNSNMGSALANGLRRYVQQQLNELQAKIKSTIENRIAGSKEQLAKQMGAAQNQFEKLLNSKNSEVRSAQNTILHQTTGRGSSLNNAANQLKKAAQHLLKGLHF